MAIISNAQRSAHGARQQQRRAASGAKARKAAYRKCRRNVAIISWLYSRIAA
jgi:hypothetical protein